MATLRGEQVDRPPVSFYELNGLDEDPGYDDPFNIYTHRSWRLLVDLTREKTDRIVMRGISYASINPDPIEVMAETESFVRNGSRFTTRRVQTPSRILTTRTRRDYDVNTVWTEEPLIKDIDDLRAFLEIPLQNANADIDTSSVTRAESALGDTGIVMIDTPDPLCLAASLFDMAVYTVIAMIEQGLFH